MKKKLRNSRGVSVLEMLVAVLLLSLLTAGGVTATAAVMADYNHMGEAANAETLASTVIETISNEIRLGKDITVRDADGNVSTTTGPSLHFGVSAFSGENATLKLDDSVGNNTGSLVAVTKNAAGVENSQKVLSEDTYSGLYLKGLTFEKIEGEDSMPGAGAGGAGGGGAVPTTKRTVFKISFTVCSDYSDDLWTGSVCIAPMFE